MDFIKVTQNKIFIIVNIYDNKHLKDNVQFFLEDTVKKKDK